MLLCILGLDAPAIGPPRDAREAVWLKTMLSKVCQRAETGATDQGGNYLRGTGDGKKGEFLVDKGHKKRTFPNHTPRRNFNVLTGT